MPSSSLHLCRERKDRCDDKYFFLKIQKPTRSIHCWIHCWINCWIRVGFIFGFIVGLHIGFRVEFPVVILSLHPTHVLFLVFSIEHLSLLLQKKRERRVTQREEKTLTFFLTCRARLRHPCALDTRMV